MDYNKLTNQEIVDKMKILEYEFLEIKKDTIEKYTLMEQISAEYNKAESVIKKRLNIKN